MKKKIALAVLAASVLFSASAFASENVLAPSPVGQQQLVPYGAVSKDGYFKGIRLAGKVKVVKNFGDIKVQVVKNFNKIGEWQFVENFPDFTIQFVDNFPDIKIQYVDNFPGVP